MSRDPLRYFRIEARELVDQISRGVLDLDRETGSEPVARLLRLAHTLKGAARVVRQTGIADRAHTLEEILVPYRDGDGAVPPADVTRLLHLADDIAAGVAGLPSAPGATDAADPSPVPVEPGPDPAAPAPAPAPAPRARAEPAETPAGRPEPSDVDDLLHAVDETHGRLTALRNGTATLERLQRAADALADELRGRVGGSGHHPARSAALHLASELTAFALLLSDSSDQVERELGEVRGRAERLRLVTTDGVLTQLRRAVRDVAEEQGKQVTFDSDGGDLRLDPQILTQVGGALMHVVRNAVAHGIEPPADREAAGKPPTGRVTVEVVRRGRLAAFRCRDDGRGFDLAALRLAAEAKGLLAPDAPAPAPGELISLVLHGGVSTTERVTEVSGRGIGLDAVRDVAEKLGGEVVVDTLPGAGTTVEMVVPLSLVAIRGLVVEAGGQTLGLPLDRVLTCRRLSAEEYADATTVAALPHAGEVHGFVPLARAVSGEPAGPGAAGAAVIISAGPGTAAIGVDRLRGTAAMIVRPLPDLAPADPIVAGTFLAADGTAHLVLDPDAVVERTGRLAGTGAETAPRGPAAAREPILVIDDSLTTRMLERSILESAGYPVDVAASAEEALDKARRRRYSLFLTDIDMPGMDGFTFVEVTRADPELREVPAILVSSRASAEDRRRGAEAGASAYVVKSEFNQDHLLGIINGLVPAGAS